MFGFVLVPHDTAVSFEDTVDVIPYHPFCSPSVNETKQVVELRLFLDHVRFGNGFVFGFPYRLKPGPGFL